AVIIFAIVSAVDFKNLKFMPRCTATAIRTSTPACSWCSTHRQSARSLSVGGAEGTKYASCSRVIPFAAELCRFRVHPAEPTIGLRTNRANEMWHIDTTVIRLLDGSRAYLHAAIDSFSRRILAWRVAETFTPANSVALLVEASRRATRSETT